MLELDRRGLVAVACFSAEFESGVVAWRGVHGFDAAAVYVPHPIQPLDDDEVRARADAAFAGVMAAIGGLEGNR